MENNEIETYFGRCRCCLSYSYLKGMWSPHKYKNQIEVYGEMLTQCFGINWDQLASSKDDLICEVCVMRLRDAHCFQKLVMLSMKVLPEVDYEDPNISMTKDSSMGDNSIKDDKIEFSHIEYLEDEAFDESDLQSTGKSEINNQLKQSESSSKKTKSHIGQKRIKSNIRHVKDAAKTNMKRELTTRKESKIIIRKFKENVLSILQNSNATPIGGHFGIGYACNYCHEQTACPKELKLHTLNMHDVTNEFRSVKSVNDIIMKADVTKLLCKICNTEMDSLGTLKTHLSSHNILIHTDINDYIIPFKFDTEYLQCALCSKQFEYFKSLSEHMNVHYRNYECDKCDRGFINARALRTHTGRHKTGTFVCSYCPKIFDTHIKMIEHERVLHVNGNKVRKCSYCNEKFIDAVKKMDHEIQIHGADPPVFECKACGKNYENQRSLKFHMKNFHLLLRPHNCQQCGKSFYSKSQLKSHEVSHSGVKEFQCKVCLKWYGLQKSLKIHMRIHDDDRRFKCEICGMAFVQKNSLNIHMKKH